MFGYKIDENIYNLCIYIKYFIIGYLCSLVLYYNKQLE